MSVEHLRNQDAIDKLAEMVNSIDVGMMGTKSSINAHTHFVPMSRQEVDADGNIWFLTSIESETCLNIEQHNAVNIVFADPKNYQFLVVEGRAVISRDQQRIDKYWNKMMEGWFDKGKEDPRIRVLKVQTEDAQYWDTASNKLVTLIKMAASAITGEQIDVGREGKLDL